MIPVKYLDPEIPGYAIFTAFAICAYLTFEGAVLIVSPTMIQSALFNLGAMLAFFAMSIGYYQLFHELSPTSIRLHLAINLFGILLHFSCIPELMQVEVDVQKYWAGLYPAEACMALALIPLAHCLWHSPFTPRFLSVLYVAFGVLWLTCIVCWHFEVQIDVLDWVMNLEGGAAQAALAIFLAKFTRNARRMQRERLTTTSRDVPSFRRSTPP
ncbi:hypothetical protein QVA66_02210 [Staphylococcus chromogenes]|nr:hypothetical protein [Staphylococcus chromogenes]